ncbi:MAG: diguanylate cyclase [Alphaproteobacteria bacterium]|nr:diguanylate cyclase [Alphaproteobacteria bacterium]
MTQDDSANGPARPDHELADRLLSGYEEPAILFDPEAGRIVANRQAERQYFLQNHALMDKLADLAGSAVGGGKVVTANVTTPLRGKQSIYQITLVPHVLGEQVLFLFRDQTIDVNLRDALIESRQRFKDLVEVSSDFSWETDANGRFVFVSRAGALGFSADDMVGRAAIDFVVSAEEYDPIPFAARKSVQDIEIWMHRADGALSCVILSAIPFVDEKSDYLGARGVCRDVTHERERATALAQAHQREQVLGYIVNTIRDEIDPTNMLGAAAAASARALGADASQILRRKPQKDVSAMAQYDISAHYGDLDAGPLPTDALKFDEGSPWQHDFEVGDWRILAAPCIHAGKVNGVLALWKHQDWSDDDRLLVNDISNQLGIAIEQIANHESIVRISRTDPMTGLLNRRAFYEEELPRRFKRLEHDSGTGALFYVDMDNFKLVNDVHGHQKGDEAILALSDLLHDFVRPGDVIARLGGDEFALWLDGMDETAAVTRSRKLLDMAKSLRKFSGSPQAPLGISIGIAIYQPGMGEDLPSLMGRADNAMYEVKQNSKGDFCLAPSYGAAP